jgi:hypothetical protein
MPAAASKKQPLTPQPVERTASGTIIQPTTTIIPDGNGRNKVIVIPRRCSYLDTGTEVSVGDRSFQDYVLPPGGDPGRPYGSTGLTFKGPAGVRCRAPSTALALIPTTRFEGDRAPATTPPAISTLHAQSGPGSGR